jgi:hypothetical protein
MVALFMTTPGDPAHWWDDTVHAALIQVNAG